MSEKVDLLNREEFIGKLKSIVKLLADKKQGCCFAIDGAWGSGKSFVLEKFEEEIKPVASDKTLDDKYLVYHYDCWKYDYYEEPAIAIVAAMQDTTEKELSVLPENVENGARLAWNTTKGVLTKVASELCKNKIGIDLVEIASEVLEEHDEDKDKDEEFDSLYGFKRALDKTRAGIKEIAEDKTVVVVVDELDRCLPEYAIKVLERLHHIFKDIDNVIVIISMDKSQLAHSIKGIYGDITVDKYLRKFISFRVCLDNGNTTSYAEKFGTYFSMFEIYEQDKAIVEKFFTDILSNMDMRTKEEIFRKAEIIHNIIASDKAVECSIMTFEILFLTVSYKLGCQELAWLAAIWKMNYVDYRNKLGVQYYKMLDDYGEKIRSNTQWGEKWLINDHIIGRTFFWLDNVYSTNGAETCKHYCYGEDATERIELVHKFAELVQVIDSN